MSIILGLLAMAGTFGAILLLVSLRQRKRREGLQAAALRLGFTFSAEGPTESLRHLPLFEKGHSPSAQNTLRGETAAMEVVLFDYDYTVGRGENSTTTFQTVAMFPKHPALLPEFALRPRGTFDILKTMFGGVEMIIPDQPSFSKRYILSALDERGVREIFLQGACDYLAQNPGWSVEAREHSLIVYRAGRRIAPCNLAAFLTPAVGIASILGR